MKKVIFVISFFLINLVLIATDVSGNQSGTWDLAGSPYNLIGEITVPAGETLTIDAGVEVIAMGNYKITAEGTITAVAAAGDTIRFFGNGGLNWGGIRLEDEINSSTFSYCRISNTDDTNDYGIHSVNSPVNIYHSLIDDHQKGVSFSGLSSNNPSYMEITHSKITNVQKSGITIVDNSNVLIDNCEVTQCGLGTQFYGAIQLSLQSSSHSCSPTITNNYIHHNGKQGITMANLYGYANMAPIVEDNDVSYNYTGIYLYGGQGIYNRNHIHHNFVQNNADSGAGVMLYGSSAYGIFTYNIVHHNYTGFYLTAGATANLGDLNNTDPDDDGYNCIYDNIFFTGEEFSVYNASSANVTAENTVWDDDPPLNVTIIDGNDDPSYGIVDFDPILSPYAPPSGVNAVLSNGFVNFSIEGGTAYPTYKIMVSYNIYRDGVLLASGVVSPFFIDPIPAIPGSSYTYGASIVYEGGFESAIVDTTISIPHILNPPQNLQVVIDPPNVIFSWDDPEPGSTSPPSNLGFFNVYLDGALLGVTNDNEWIIEDLVNGQTYTAGVCANYEAGASDIVEIQFIYNPTIINNPPQNAIVSPIGLMEWEEPLPGSTGDFLFYYAYLDGILQGNTTDLFWQFTGLVPGQTYVAEVSAVYEDGESDLVEATWEQIDHDPPANAGYDVFPDHIHLYWDEPNQYVDEYHIYVDGEMHTTTELFYDIYDLLPGLEYEIGLTAYYIDGIESDPIVFNILFTDANNILNHETQLLGNYPNPFNPSTEIRFQISDCRLAGTTNLHESARIDIYNLKGQIIKSLSHTEFIEACGKPNSFSVVWDGTDESSKPVSSGVYFYKLIAADKTFFSKMLLMK